MGCGLSAILVAREASSQSFPTYLLRFQAWRLELTAYVEHNLS